MMRLVMEAVMVLAVVGVLAFMMKIGKGDQEDQPAPDDPDPENRHDER